MADILVGTLARFPDRKQKNYLFLKSFGFVLK